MIYRFLPRFLITSIHNIGICDRCNVKFHFSTTWYLHIVFIYTVTWWPKNSWSDLSKNCFCQSKVLILMCLLNSNMLPVQQATQPSNSVSHFLMRNTEYVQILGSPLIYNRQAWLQSTVTVYQKFKDNDLYKGILIETVSIYILQFRKRWIMYICICLHVHSNISIQNVL